MICPTMATMSATVTQFPKQHYSSWDAGVGANIKRLLVGRTNQTSLAAAVGIAQPELSKRLSGKTKWKGEELALIAAALGVTITEVCTLDYGGVASLIDIKTRLVS